MPEPWIDSKSRRRMQERQAAREAQGCEGNVAVAGQFPPPRARTLLALDPASRRAGYAVASGLRPEDLHDAGVLKASEARSHVERRLVDAAVGASAQPWMTDLLMQPELHAYRRIASLVTDVRELITGCWPDLIVVEVPSGLFGAGAKKKAKGSLTTYGAAAGAIWWACEEMCPGRVVPVTERQWTPGSGDKEGRQQAVAATYSGRYDPAQDPGGDTADAISLLRWFILEHGRKLA